MNFSGCLVELEFSPPHIVFSKEITIRLVSSFDGLHDNPPTHGQERQGELRRQLLLRQGEQDNLIPRDPRNTEKEIEEENPLHSNKGCLNLKLHLNLRFNRALNPRLHVRLLNNRLLLRWLKLPQQP